MTDNGQPSPEQLAKQGPTPEMLVATAAQIEALTPGVKQVVGTMMRGLMVSAPGVPPHLLLSVFCWQCGNLCGEALVGDIASMIEIRNTFRESFLDGLQKAKLVQPIRPGAMPPKVG